MRCPKGRSGTPARAGHQPGPKGASARAGGSRHDDFASDGAGQGGRERAPKRASAEGKPATGRRIEAILFDLGGVIVEIVGMDRLLRWSRQLPDMATMWERWLASPAVRSYETGRSSRAAFARDVIDEFGFDVDAATFLAEFARWPRRLYPDSAPLLEGLRGRFRLASLSNTNEIHWDRYEREWALPGLFHANFPSFAVGRIKPDADYFEHVLGTLGLEPEQALFVDDVQLNVDAASAVGLVARRAVGPQGVRDALRELGLEAEEHT